MKTANELTVLVDDLAAYWTEPTLEILKDAGLPEISVEMELQTWRMLHMVLDQELRWQRSFRVSTLVSLSTLMERVLREAALVIAGNSDPDTVTYEFEIRIRRLASERRSTKAERELYSRIVRQPALHAAFKAPSRTDFTPRLRVSTVVA